MYSMRAIISLLVKYLGIGYKIHCRNTGNIKQVNKHKRTKYILSLLLAVYFYLFLGLVRTERKKKKEKTVFQFAKFSHTDNNNKTFVLITNINDTENSLVQVIYLVFGDQQQQQQLQQQ